MANQAEVTKLNQYVLIGPPADTVTVSKLVMYVLLTPGAGGDDNRQGHTHAQIITRRS